MSEPTSRKIIPPSELYAQYRNCDRWAVIVGISNYQHRDWNLRYADRDAEELYKLLLTPSGGGFKPENVCKLINETATTGNITRALRGFLKKPAREDLVLIYFACHGAPDFDRPDNVYLLTHDTDPNEIAGTALPMREIDDSLKGNLHAKKVVILVDACHSAAVGGGIGSRNAIPEATVLNRYLQEMSRAKDGLALITSAEANEAAQEHERWGGGHGVFTHFLLEGMRGAADTDDNDIVTIGELFEYVRDRVKQETNHKQHPVIGANAYDRSLPISIKPRSVFSKAAEAATGQYTTRSNAEPTEEEFHLVLELALTPDEMARGVEKPIYTGFENITLRVPAGIEPGKRIRAKGKGKLNSATQQRGDLYLVVMQAQPSPSDSQLTKDHLKFEAKNDYTLLNSSLQARNWAAANQESLRLLLKVVNREKQSWLRLEDFAQLPTQELHVIDELWMRHSAGRFGFRNQKRIWNGVSRSSENKYLIRDFCRACGCAERRGGVVGWWSGDKILSMEEIYEFLNDIGAFDSNSGKINDVPEGLLPTTAHWSWVEKGQEVRCLSTFFSRI